LPVWRSDQIAMPTAAMATATVPIAVTTLVESVGTMTVITSGSLGQRWRRAAQTRTTLPAWWWHR